MAGTPVIRMLPVILALVAMPLQACTPQTLYELIAQRLSHMPAVAAYKYQHGLPVTDPQREVLVLERSADQARALGLSSARVVPFMQAQMEAAKVIQQALVQQWQSQGRRRSNSAATQPDLIGTIRPQLIALGRQQLQAIRCLRDNDETPGPEDRPGFDRAIGSLGLPAVVADALFSSLEIP